MKIDKADRVKKLPPYLFKEIDRMKAEIIQRGVDVIDLGVGDPDLPTPKHIIESLKKAVDDPSTHRYPSYSGMNDFKEAVARWYKKRFGIELDPGNEVVTLIGSKEGIAHLPLAFINNDDIALVASPCYPVYHTATMFAGGSSYFLPLTKENKFLPDLNQIPEEIANKAKLLFINYPNNPTAATAEKDFFQEVIDFANAYDIIVCHDAAYTELAYDGYKPISFLEVPGAKEVGIEFHSLSKTYNMTGWRLGFAVGNAEIISGLGQIKSNIDSGAFNAIQIAGITALDSSQDCVKKNCEIYQERRDILVRGLNKVGIKVETPRATFYVWCEVPEGYTSAEFASLLLKEAGIVVTPGNGFGDPGEGFIRMALTVDKGRLEEAISRMEKLNF